MNKIHDKLIEKSVICPYCRRHIVYEGYDAKDDQHAFVCSSSVCSYGLGITILPGEEDSVIEMLLRYVNSDLCDKITILENKLRKYCDVERR